MRVASSNSVLGLLPRVLLLALAMWAGSVLAGGFDGKKVLYINSYHLGYGGSDPITQGVEAVLRPEGIDLRVIYMDTKRNPDEAFIEEAAAAAIAEIDAFDPDVVIASDDNASKYVIMPHYRDANLPFVFCGVNWDASVYGFPYTNVTGMVEVALVSEILEHLRKYAKGERVGFIAGDRLSERKNLEHYQRRFQIQFDSVYFAQTFDEWKAAFEALQDEADMVMMTSHVGIEGWDDEAARAFVLETVRVPVGSEHEWEMPLALVGVTKDFEEMGLWAARAALAILDGTSPADIPITANKKGRLYFNVSIAEKLGIPDTPPLATLVE